MFETDYSRVPDTFPDKLASDWGQDERGFFQVFTINKVRQVFRWIFPGRFLMGSHVNEAERDDDEVQHEVVLARGFWLADTACTQELWKVVMDDNPSSFTDNTNNPVENVSWDMCKEFIGKMNELEPSLELRLPTEAEWEYVCRAGTETPFCFGENITTEQVNYNGKYSYKGVRKGEYRKKTVKVKRILPCNNWGLYQMNGNVWEWCEDWFGDYNLEEKTDPEGPKDGEYRVLRGGSWYNHGRDVRSAYRNGHEPGFRNDRTGFRLVRGQK